MGLGGDRTGGSDTGLSRRPGGSDGGGDDGGNGGDGLAGRAIFGVLPNGMAARYPLVLSPVISFLLSERFLFLFFSLPFRPGNTAESNLSRRLNRQ